MPRFPVDSAAWKLEDLKAVADFLEKEIWVIVDTAGLKSGDQEVRERCSRVELILRAAIFVLKTPPDDSTRQDPAGYIAGKLNAAIGQYGLEVVRH